jgi:hypothetical protein
MNQSHIQIVVQMPLETWGAIMEKLFYLWMAVGCLLVLGGIIVIAALASEDSK